MLLVLRHLDPGSSIFLHGSLNLHNLAMAVYAVQAGKPRVVDPKWLWKVSSDKGFPAIPATWANLIEVCGFDLGPVGRRRIRYNGRYWNCNPSSGLQFYSRRIPRTLLYL